MVNTPTPTHKKKANVKANICAVLIRWLQVARSPALVWGTEGGGEPVGKEEIQPATGHERSSSSGREQAGRQGGSSASNQSEDKKGPDTASSHTQGLKCCNFLSNLAVFLRYTQPVCWHWCGDAPSHIIFDSRRKRCHTYIKVYIKKYIYFSFFFRMTYSFAQFRC